MAIPIMIPLSGELGREITLVRWLVHQGDAVEAGAPLAEIEADKGVLEVEAPAPGSVLAVLCSAGETVAPGAVLGYLGRPGEEVRSDPARPQAAPATRRLAAALGVDLEAVTPTGAGGVVIRHDVEAAVGRGAAARSTAVGPASAGVPAVADASRPLSPNQRTVAAQVGRSHREIPPAHFTTRLDARRAVQLREGGIGWTALFVHAAALALARYAALRSRLEANEVLTSPGAHVAFAVAGESGELYTPVLRDAEALDLEATDARVRGLAAAAREHRLGPEAYAGGAFLVTNLGMFAVESFDPVIHPGHSGALAVGAMQMLPVAVPSGQSWGVEVRPTLSLTLAVDHRLINGADAARALGYLKELVEGGTE